MNRANSRAEGVSTVAALRDASATLYAGDVTPAEAFECLTKEGGALIDVRTQPEWQFVGVPDLRAHHIPTHLISWKNYPNFQLNPTFEAEINAVVPDKNIPIFFLCRSGGRSLDAAIAMTQKGYRCCFNIAGGFEGEPDVSSKRGTNSGWKASALPWSQT